ncbi:MAG TPA: hypothetical protein VFA07_14550, partial [Chthonomonadaceae bacterium]|nr:hypothetical protein [Chthonomonadaceae bacterium]
MFDRCNRLDVPFATLYDAPPTGTLQQFADARAFSPGRNDPSGRPLRGHTKRAALAPASRRTALA